MCAHMRGCSLTCAFLQVLGDSLDAEAIHRGDITPLYFGSAMSSFGVELFLQSFINLSAKPGVGGEV